MAVTEIVVFWSQPEPLGPAVGHVLLRLACQVGDVVFLHPGEMPDQPADGVGFGIWPVVEPSTRQLGGRAVYLATDPPERFGQNVVRSHSFDDTDTARLSLDPPIVFCWVSSEGSVALLDRREAWWLTTGAGLVQIVPVSSSNAATTREC